MSDDGRDGQQRIIDEALAQLEEEALRRGESFDQQKVNLAELERRTGITRSRLRTLKKKDFKVGHGRCGMRKEETKISKFTGLIDKELRRGVTNSEKILAVIRKKGYKGGRTIVWEYVSAHIDLVPSTRRLAADRPDGNRGRRFKTGPGESFQMDWGFVNLVDILGVVWKIACFAMICHHCGACFVEFFTNARQENLLIGMLHAFSALGVPDWVLTDNMRSVVVHRDGNGMPVWNKDYELFMRRVGFRTRLCKPRHPFTKGKVERLIRYVKGNMLAGYEFTNITDLNRDALVWCAEQGGRYHKAVDCVPDERHAEACAKVARKLVVTDEIAAYLCPPRRISFDGFVTYEGRRFGVPYWYEERVCRVSREGDVLHVYSSDLTREIAAYDVTWSRADRLCDDQYAGDSPEEQPSQPPTTTVVQVEGPTVDPKFAKFDFGGES